MQINRDHGKTRIADPRLLVPWSEAASRNRLSSTLFLAGLLHGIILLGVTFSGSNTEPPATSTSFEVVLVTNDYEDAETNTDSELLAQRNMAGAGNTDEQLQLKTALSQSLDAGVLGPDQMGAENPQQLNAAQREERPTIVAKSLDNVFEMADYTVEEELSPELQQQSMTGESSAIEIINKPEAETLITDTERRELVISANTREARIAAYLSKWKNQIEQIGTMNYPNAALSGGLTQFRPSKSQSTRPANCAK